MWILSSRYKHSNVSVFLKVPLSYESFISGEVFLILGNLFFPSKDIFFIFYSIFVVYIPKMVRLLTLQQLGLNVKLLLSERAKK